jgi:glycosyltransferase involved in cell wall biosynthesis
MQEIKGRLNLILFFTYGISLKIWDETGLLDREILLYKRLIEKGIKVSFITYGDESDYQYQEKLGDIEIIPFYAFVKKPHSSILRYIQSLFLPFILKKYLKEADIIKTNQMSTTFAPLIAKILYRKKLIVRCGFEWYYFLLKRGASLITRLRMFLTEFIYYHFADAIILTSEKDKYFVSQRFGIDQNKINVIKNFIDCDVFKPFENIYKKKNAMLFIGRLTNQKNLFNLLESLRGSKYTLDIIGDGELKDELIKFAKENDIKVNFLGRIPNSKVPDLLNQYEVFILPSFYEGNPKALLEAMACGLVVIGTDVDGIREVIEHRVNGYLCKTDSKSIREAIDTVMADDELRKNMGKNAREYIVKNYDIGKILMQELQLYSKILQC